MVPLRIANTRFFQQSSAAEAIGISFANTLSLLGKPMIEADVYKSALDLSDMSDAMNFGTAGSIVPRHVSDLKPCVYDAPLRGSGA